jgi:hypothetical protein
VNFGTSFVVLQPPPDCVSSLRRDRVTTGAQSELSIVPKARFSGKTRPSSQRASTVSAQCLGCVACLGWNVCQPDRVLVDLVACHKAERWPRPSEEWLAATKHDGAQVESVLINQAEVGQALR